MTKTALTESAKVTAELKPAPNGRAAAIDGEGAPALHESGPASAATGRTWLRPWHILVAVVTLGIVIAAASLLSRREKTSPAQTATPDAETTSSVTTLSPEQRSAIT